MMTLREIYDNCILDSNDCWIWKGNVDAYGYAYTGCGNNKLKITRLVCHLIYGLDLGNTNQLACHIQECPSKTCVNPEHLYKGDAKTNSADMIKNGNHFSGAAQFQSNKRFCVNGHEYTRENTRITSNGYRRCRACDKIHSEKQNRKKGYLYR